MKLWSRGYELSSVEFGCLGVPKVRGHSIKKTRHISRNVEGGKRFKYIFGFKLSNFGESSKVQGVMSEVEVDSKWFSVSVSYLGLSGKLWPSPSEVKSGSGQ